ASETAVLNANYLLAKLKQVGVTQYLPPAYDRLCMHEFVLSGAPMKKELGLRTLDIAKRLLDYGFHPPTVYFPLLVDEAMMVEPTETEGSETLAACGGAGGAVRGGARPRAPARWTRCWPRPSRPRRSPATRRTRRRSGGSTRSAPRSARWCASRCRGISGSDFDAVVAL